MVSLGETNSRTTTLAIVKINLHCFDVWFDLTLFFERVTMAFSIGFTVALFLIIKWHHISSPAMSFDRLSSVVSKHNMFQLDVLFKCQSQPEEQTWQQSFSFPTRQNSLSQDNSILSGSWSIFNRWTTCEYNLSNFYWFRQFKNVQNEIYH